MRAQDLFISSFFSDPLLYLSIVLVVTFSIVMHELAHGFVATMQGDSTPRELGYITLNPLKLMGIPSMVLLAITGYAWGRMEFSPDRLRLKRAGETLVSVAGPAMNALLASLAIAALRIWALELSAHPQLLGTLKLISYVNVFMTAINLCPIPGLDGLSAFSPYSRLIRFIETNQYVAIPITLSAVFLFVYTGANKDVFLMVRTFVDGMIL